MNETEQKIESDAYEFVKDHSDEIIQRFAGNSVKVATPVSLFMAGSPGAGKTEVSKNLMKQFETIPVRIDADEIRKMCPNYIGTNAHIFQKAARKGVHILYDHSLHKGLHLILDGTFAYGESLKNIERSLDYKRVVELWFVYQDPMKAWEFTRAREALESRHISKETFISTFIKSKLNAVEAKRTFRNSLVLNLLVKNINNTDGKLYLNVQAHELDPYIGSTYTSEDLGRVLI